MYVLSTFLTFLPFFFPCPFCYMFFYSLSLDCWFSFFYLFLALLFVCLDGCEIFLFPSFFLALLLRFYLWIVVSFFPTNNSSSFLASFPYSAHNLVVCLSVLWQADLYTMSKHSSAPRAISFYCSRNANSNLVIFVTTKMSNVICLQ